MSADLIDRAYTLLERGRLEEAREISTRLVDPAQPSHAALALHCTVLNAAGRHEDALLFNRKAIERFPTDGTAWHNLAATLIDLGRGHEALEALAKGFSLGLDSPVTYQVKARAHVACGDAAGAEAAYQEASRRAPAFADLAVERADFVWMARGDLAAAQVVLDRAFHAGAPPAPLLLAKAKLLSSAGDREQAAALLARGAEGLPDECGLIVAAAQAALEADSLPDAERLAHRARDIDPQNVSALVQLTIVNLALGRIGAASESIRKALSLSPLDQSVLAWASTASRAAGDPLYRELCDYEHMVGIYEVEPPPGWATKDDFLNELKAALDKHHVLKEHPSAQSLRHGTQTSYQLTGAKEAVIQAFFRAIDGPIREHLEKLGRGPDPLRSRKTGNYQIAGAWSVRLRSGGFHLDHMHHRGWLSSAFYVETPEDALKQESRDGWLRLGQPPYRTVPTLPAERFIRPVAGRLVLFPSYMWHGTAAFHTDEWRTTIAFDLLPV